MSCHFSRSLEGGGLSLIKVIEDVEDAVYYLGFYSLFSYRIKFGDIYNLTFKSEKPLALKANFDGPVRRTS